MQVWGGKYGVATTYPFILYSADGTKITTGATFAAGDVKISKDGGAPANTTNLPAHNGNGIYDIALTATEMQAETIAIAINDQTATELWLGTGFYVWTSGNASAMFEFDLDDPTPDVGSVSILGSGSITNVAFSTSTALGCVELLYAGPLGPGIYIDPGGVAGSSIGLNGRPRYPTTTWANALTLASSLGINRFYLQNGASVTLTGDSSNYEIIGLGEISENTVNLGNQECGGALFFNLELTGTQGGTGRAGGKMCLINAVTTLHMAGFSVGFNGNSTLTSNDDHIFDQWFSMVPGNGTPEITLNTNSSVVLRHGSGGMQFNSGGPTNSVSMETDGQAVIDATCSNFDITLRGNMEVTDNGTSTAITDDAVFDRNNPVPVSPSVPITFTVGATNLDTTTCSSDLSTQGYTTSMLFQNRAIKWGVGSVLEGSVAFIETYDGTTGDLTFSQQPGIPALNDTAEII